MTELCKEINNVFKMKLLKQTLKDEGFETTGTSDEICQRIIKENLGDNLIIKINSFLENWNNRITSELYEKLKKEIRKKPNVSESELLISLKTKFKNLNKSIIKEVIQDIRSSSEESMIDEVLAYIYQLLDDNPKIKNDIITKNIKKRYPSLTSVKIQEIIKEFKFEEKPDKLKFGEKINLFTSGANDRMYLDSVLFIFMVVFKKMFEKYLKNRPITKNYPSNICPDKDAQEQIIEFLRKSQADFFKGEQIDSDVFEDMISICDSDSKTTMNIINFLFLIMEFPLINNGNKISIKRYARDELNQNYEFSNQYPFFPNLIVKKIPNLENFGIPIIYLQDTLKPIGGMPTFLEGEGWNKYDHKIEGRDEGEYGKIKENNPGWSLNDFSEWVSARRLDTFDPKGNINKLYHIKKAEFLIFIISRDNKNSKFYPNEKLDNNLYLSSIIIEKKGNISVLFKVDDWYIFEFNKSAKRYIISNVGNWNNIIGEDIFLYSTQFWYCKKEWLLKEKDFEGIEEIKKVLPIDPSIKCNKYGGLTNYMNSCYIDSAIVSLLFEKNNFIDDQILNRKIENLPYKNPELIKLAKLIQEDLKEIQNAIIKNPKLLTCKNIRRHFQNFYNILGFHKGDQRVDWIQAQEDVGEVFGLISNIFPIPKNDQLLFNLTSYGTNDLAINNKKLASKEKRREEIITIDFTGEEELLIKNIIPKSDEYIEFTDGNFFEINDKKYKYRIAEKELIEANYLIIKIIRIRGDNKLFNKVIPKEKIILKNGTTLSLSAIILHQGYSPQGGHYISYLNCNETWFLYDDTAREKLKKFGDFSKIINEEYILKNSTYLIYVK